MLRCNIELLDIAGVKSGRNSGNPPQRVEAMDRGVGAH